MILIWNLSHQQFGRTNFSLLTPGKYLCYQLARTITVLTYRRYVLRITMLTIRIAAERYIMNTTVTDLFWSKKSVTHMWDKVCQRKTSLNWQENITSAKTIKGSQELLQMHAGIWEKTFLLNDLLIDRWWRQNFHYTLTW